MRYRGDLRCTRHHRNRSLSRQDSYGKPLKKRGLISHRQAFDLLVDDVQFIAVCGANMGHGEHISDTDRARCLSAAGRIAYLRDEVMS